MHEYAQDAIAYVRLYGRPDLFITFTCNQSWDEIKHLLLQGQSAVHRHDITARFLQTNEQTDSIFYLYLSILADARRIRHLAPASGKR